MLAVRITTANVSVTTTGINTDAIVTTTGATNAIGADTTSATDVIGAIAGVTNAIGASTTTYTYIGRATAAAKNAGCSMYLPGYMVIKAVVMIYCCLHVISKLGH